MPQIRQAGTRTRDLLGYAGAPPDPHWPGRSPGGGVHRRQFRFSGATNRFSGAADFAGYAIDAFDWLHREGANAPKMMSIGLHLRMIRRPGRIGVLVRILRYITIRGYAWIARRVDIANHWLAQFPCGGSTCPHL
jgi:peptidoglycan/xylan/chitin deacetylase (PgdA/CDA1 family)